MKKQLGGVVLTGFEPEPEPKEKITNPAAVEVELGAMSRAELAQALKARVQAGLRAGKTIDGVE